jgi:hypothetical protein
LRIRDADGDRVVSAKKRKTAAASKRRVASKKGAAREKRPHTTGAVAANLHEGSRSEIIADYLFASWGTVTPVRRQDDHGLDLYCTLTGQIGQRAIVTDYYAVQIKSTLDPLKFETPESVRWLVENPNPVFLACVDKKKGVLRVFQLMTRFHVAIGQLPPSLTISLEDATEGRCISSFDDDPDQLSASAPILRIEWVDILDDEKMEGYREVLADWVRIDRTNLDRRVSGILRYQMPVDYRTNERPEDIRMEAGNFAPDDAQMAKALEKLVDTLDCVGHQLLQRKDRKAAFLATALLRYLRVHHASELPRRWQPTADTSLEGELRRLIDREFQRDDPLWIDLLATLDPAMAADPLIAAYLTHT